MFVHTCLEYYGLDPSNYFSSAGLSWDSMIKTTKIELEVVSDIDMCLFFKKGMRGDISYIAKRFNKANNKYMKCYNDTKTSKYIMYFGAHIIYGSAMSQYLPYSKFKWLNKKIDKFDVHLIGKNSFDGFMLAADLKYPDHLPELNNVYPLASEKLEINHNMLSKHCNKVENKYDINIDGVNKLVPNFGSKK